MTTTIHDTLKDLARGHVLSDSDAESLFEALLTGELDDAQIGAALGMLQVRGISIAELTGAARVMRSHVEPVPYQPAADERLIDTCGTGGAPKTFNVSTAAAIASAACQPPASTGVSRIVVAKHGNRSRTGRGSAEVLAQLGVNVDASPEKQAHCLSETGVCFCFAIHHHPAMRHAAGPRRSLGFPTAFNLLGPLTNPARATRQLIGVYEPEAIDRVAGTLHALGCERAIVAHARDGLDELSVDAPTDYALVTADGVTRDVFDPGNTDLASAPRASLEAESVEDAARVIRAVFNNEAGFEAHRDMVALNAAAALCVAGVVGQIAEGLPIALEAITSGRAGELLEKLAEVSKA